MPFFDMGELPLGNAFLKKEDFDKEKRYKLELGICRACGLVQQTKPPPVEALQQDYRNYSYVPFGETLAQHYAAMAKEAAEEASLSSSSTVVDVGSNDGLLLRSIRKLFPQGLEPYVLGIEPAEKISKTARQNGIPTITAFFSKKVADDILDNWGSADLVCCTAVLQHIPDLNEFMKNVARILKPTGVFMTEGRYFGATVQKTSYDTMYHEMLYFFTSYSLKNLLKRHHLYATRAKTTEVYGGSLRMYARKTKSRKKIDVGLASYEGIDVYKTCIQFADRAKAKAIQLQSLVTSLKAKGKRIAAYGAPSTSATLLNYAGIGAGEIEYIVDDSPLKQGLYTPGTHIKIVPHDVLEVDPPDYLLINAWRLRNEIIPKVPKGIRCIIPLPEVSVV